MKRRLLGLTALAALLVSSTAMAQTRFIAFGDSLSDNGNDAFWSGGAFPPAFAYPMGRFSNGLAFAEIFAGGTMKRFDQTTPLNVNTGNVNFAFGAAATSGANLYPFPFIQNTQTQITNYLGMGGGFGAGDVVTLWAGANNLFRDLPGAAAVPATAQATMAASATTAATNVGAQIGMLAASGAKTIVTLNLPNFSGLPNFTVTLPAANALAGFSSMTFNAAWLAATGAAAAAFPGTNVIQVDIASAFTAIQANPAAFGFVNATNACINTPACVGNPAGWNSYLFWDDVHPTEAGYRLVAAVAGEYLYAGQRALGFAPFGEVAFEDRRGGMIRTFNRLDSVSGMTPGRNAYYISVIGGATNADGGPRRVGYDWRNYGVTFGFDRAFTNNLAMTLGSTVTIGSLKAARVETNPTSFSVDGAVQYSSGVFFGKLAAGFGLNYFEGTTRRTVGPLENDSSTTSFASNIGLEVGTNHNLGAFSISPRARLGWVAASVDAFQESGVIAPLSIDSRTVSALVAGGELRFGFDVVNDAARKVSLNASVGYERNLAYSGQNISGRITSNTAWPFISSLASPKGAGWTFGGGASAKIGANVEMVLDYRAQLGHGEATRHSGQAGVKIAF